ncbi:MAG: hypothetical protein Q8P49_03985 [Candidatus Liptonbacteria bacterium]|nr:hypothetical protein [Candidatus Liptonbacteria bacterium]
MLHGIHEWTAHIIVRHHRFGPDPYPELPPLPDYLVAKEELINTYARLLALADYYDAITHRDNDKFGGGLSSWQKRDRCLRDNSDQAALIVKLEKEGILIF